MGDTVEFASNGNTASGYLALPASGSGPGVIVLQEWWGLNPQIKGVADRLAVEGFVALAPDLYHGELAAHDEMDKAAQLMTALPPDRAARDMGGAVDYLLARDDTTGAAVGAIGFCMGGLMALLVSALQGDKIGAAVPFYGAPLGDSAPDWSGLTAPVEGHYAENDDFFGPTAIKALEEQLREMGKDVVFHIYPGTGHAFANETDALGTYNADAAATAWGRAVEFLKSNLTF
ncbi:MAG TPA: dienelactone hydrolase family protein [Acidimicrobiales bacterium]|nr:dienelactone hydrolase family protein [Acidimicrobiales bacterium]